MRRALLLLAAPSCAAPAYASGIGSLGPVIAQALPAATDARLKEALVRYKGKPVVVNFWATWCEPCREEMPSLARLAARWKNRAAVLTVAVADNARRVDEFLWEILPENQPLPVLEVVSRFATRDRAVGLPARDVHGVRVADSKFGYKSLGKSGDITKAQHCRAEVWLANFGWVPVDPADVRKVVLEEKPGLTLADEVVVAARQKLFGAWEMNWLAYNFAHDVQLPSSSGAKVPFLMYPQAENSSGRLDSLDATAFVYKLTSKEITAA